MRVRDDIDIKVLSKYGFNCVDEFIENNEGVIWNEDASISVNLDDRSVFVYGYDEDDYQDLTVLYRMFKDGILEDPEPDLRGPKYLECSDLFGNTWYKNLWDNTDLPVGAVPLDLHNYR